MRAGALCLVALLAGCRDSPREVLETASEAAATGDLVALQEAFSATTTQRLERGWSLAQLPAAEGWQALAVKLVFQGKPLEIGAEEIHGDYAKVDARAGVDMRDYYLRKEDGRWRIELGAGQQWQKAAGEAPRRGSPAPNTSAPDSEEKPAKGS